ncbi:hypothetical protein [Burkholderia sp. LMG 32019]
MTRKIEHVYVGDTDRKMMLPPGARFIIDDTGYEDVWMDLPGNEVSQ